MDLKPTMLRILAIVLKDLPSMSTMEFANQTASNLKPGSTTAVFVLEVMPDTMAFVDNAQEAQMSALMVTLVSAAVPQPFIFPTPTCVLNVDQDHLLMPMPAPVCARVDLFHLEILVYHKFNASLMKI